MERDIFVFKDSVSQNYGEPFTLSNFAEMRREFQKLCENPSIPAYALRDTIVLHLGTFYPDPKDPRIVASPHAITVLRGDSYNVDEIRRQTSDCSSSASELSFE